jgi:hypothetical protein
MVTQQKIKWVAPWHFFSSANYLILQNRQLKLLHSLFNNKGSDFNLSKVVRVRSSTPSCFSWRYLDGFFSLLIVGQTDRKKRDSQTDGWTDNQNERRTDPWRYKKRDRHTEEQKTGRQTESTDRRTDKWMCTKTDWQTNRTISGQATILHTAQASENNYDIS